MTAQQKWDELVQRMDEVIASGEVVSRADARELVKRRYRHLADAEYPGGIGITSSQPRPGVATGSGSAEAQLSAIAKRIASERRVPFAQAYVAALNADPTLYLQYQKDQEAALGARRG